MNKFPTEEDSEAGIPLEEEIQIDGDLSDVSYRDEMRSIEQESRIEKLNHRMTLLSILLPCLLGAFFLYVYMDLKNRVSSVQTVTSTEVKGMSQEILDKMLSLSQKFADLKSSLSEDLSTLKKSYWSLEGDLKRRGQEIEEVRASKVDKEVTERLVKQYAESEKTLAALRNAFKGHEKAFKETNELLEREFKETREAIQKISDEGHKQDSAIKNLSMRIIDEEVLDKRFRDEQSKYLETIATFQTSLKSLQEELAQLQRQVNMMARSVQGLQLEKTPQGGTSSGETPKAAVAPGPEKIVEQAISE